MAFKLTWAAAVRLKKVALTGDRVRLEAEGEDWVVLRDEYGRSHALAFPGRQEKIKVIEELEKCRY